MEIKVGQQFDVVTLSNGFYVNAFNENRSTIVMGENAICNTDMYRRQGWYGLKPFRENRLKRIGKLTITKVK